MVKHIDTVNKNFLSSTGHTRIHGLISVLEDYELMFWVAKIIFGVNTSSSIATYSVCWASQLVCYSPRYTEMVDLTLGGKWLGGVS